MSYLRFLAIVLLVMASLVMADDEDQDAQMFDHEGDSLRFREATDIEKQQETANEEREYFDITPYKFALRVGFGYAATFQEIDFARDGILNASPVTVHGAEVDNGFTFPNFVGNLEAKFGLPAPLEKLALGLAFDYNTMPIKGFHVNFGQWPVFSRIKEDKITDMHILSICAFLEFRVPFRVGKSWLAPYVRVGGGVNINMSSDDKKRFDFDQATGAFMAGCGLEYFLSQSVSIFFEGRYHYNKARFTYSHNQSSKFDGEMYLGSVSMMVGFNFYFGVGKSL